MNLETPNGLRTPEAASPEKETGRLEAFSDGVFAVAITLLVLELKVPTSGENGVAGGLLPALEHQWPAFLAYLTSFLTILVMWVNHHRMFNHIRRVSERFLFLNGLLLLLITLVPFPTAVIAEYVRAPESRVVATILYAATFELIALAYNVLWHHATSNDLLVGPNPDRQAIAAITAQYRFGPPLYLVAVGLAFALPAVSIAVCLGMALFFSFSSSGKCKAAVPTEPR